jgi:hypothetical protein
MKIGHLQTEIAKLIGVVGYKVGREMGAIAGWVDTASSIHATWRQGDVLNLSHISIALTEL